MCSRTRKSILVLLGVCALASPVLGQVSISSVTLNKAEAYGGEVVDITVTLSGAAPSVGHRVSLSANKTLIELPSSITVNSGQATATARASVAYTSADSTVEIVASDGRATHTAQVVVKTPVMAGLRLYRLLDSSTKETIASAVGGTSLGVYVEATLTGPIGGTGAPASFTLPFSSSNPSLISVSSSLSFQSTGKAVYGLPPPLPAVKVSSAVTFNVGGKTTKLTVLPASLVGFDVARGERRTDQWGASASPVGGGSRPLGIRLELDGGAAAFSSVTLTSSDPAVVPVPASVDLAEFQRSATLSVNLPVVSSDKSVTLSATFRGVTKTANVTVIPLSVNQITIIQNGASVSTVFGGTPITYKMSLNEIPLNPTTVPVTSSDSSVLPFPPTVTFPQGSSSFQASLTPAAPLQQTAVTITAGEPSTAKAKLINVTPYPVASLELTPNVVHGEATVKAGLTFAAPLPAGGITIPVQSSLAGAVVPSSVTIPEGKTGWFFTIPAKASSTDLTGTITVSQGTAAKSAQLTIRLVTLKEVYAKPAAVIGPAQVTGIVALTGNALSATTVMLASSNPSVATVPESVTVEAGQWAAIFTITTTSVTAETPVTISAATAAMSVQGTLRVQPAAP